MDKDDCAVAEALRKIYDEVLKHSDRISYLIEQLKDSLCSGKEKENDNHV